MTEVTPFARLSQEQVAAVRAATTQASATDGVAPLSEAFLLALTREGAHLLAIDAGEVLGYAQIAADGSTEAFVAPSARAKGVGATLLRTVLERNPQARLWAHGDLPGARALATHLRLTVARELLVLNRAVSPGDDMDPALPEGLSHRPFVPGRDEDALLAVNARAFAHHPEQGSLDAAGLAERMAQPWFEAAGLILLEDGNPDRLAGFHWTKIDPPDTDLGEVYVVGVHPDLHGQGLAGPLTGLGLAHLARRGMREVELYVEGDNHPALRTYRKAGFTQKAVHVMYSPEVHDRVEG